MIHFIGNSHANVICGARPGAALYETKYTHPYFRNYCIGPCTAYNFCKNHLGTAIQIATTIPPKDYICLILGEIDCRWHLPKHIDLEKRSVEDVVRECVDRFFYSCIVPMRNYLGYNMLSVGLPPSTNMPHNNDPNSPIYGSCEIRNVIVCEFNRYLEELSTKLNIPFVSIYEYLIDGIGLTIQGYYSDYCHLNYEKTYPFWLYEFKRKGIICE